MNSQSEIGIKSITKKLHLHLFLAIYAAVAPHSIQAAIEPQCYKLAANYEAKYEPAAAAVRRGLRFAEQHNLPAQVLEVGPKEQRRARLFIGIDVTNKEQHDAYLKEFQLTSTEPEPSSRHTSSLSEFKKHATESTSARNELP